MTWQRTWAGVALLALAGCGGGDNDGVAGQFQLIAFFESGKNDLPRNRGLSFQFSGTIAGNQNFAERLKIENIQTGTGGSNFSLAIGTYVALGDRVLFTPRLPERADRSDAGFRAGGEYHVFVKSGPDSLRSANGDRIARQQEFLFGTTSFFEDFVPAQPPRALSATARDRVSGDTFDLSRLDASPPALAGFDSAALLASGRALEPGAGGGPAYATPWEFDVEVSEPLDPATVTTETVQLLEIRNDALETATTASPGHFGTPVAFRVPIVVQVLQRPDPATGVLRFLVRVTPRQTLVDDARYRLTLSGDVLGLDFRKTFIGDNGLTGAEIGAGGAFTEPGGLGYVTEFVVFDRPGIVAARTLTYDPLVDGIRPESGQTTTDEALFNSALYNPLTDPGAAVGFLSAFGGGRDGSLAVSGGNTVTLDTGDTPNPPLAQPFTVTDLNPDDDYLSDTRPGGPVTYDSPEPFELELETLTVSSSSTLRVVGVNPLFLRVAGIAQVSGTVDAAGGDGAAGGGATAPGGIAGAGGFVGGRSQAGAATCSYRPASCSDFALYLTNCAQGNALHPLSVNGGGPGRGLAGGDAYTDYSTDEVNNHGGTGGGGASHARPGARGEDRRNAAGAPGTAGPSCSTFANVRNAGVIGVRGMPGPTYGDREIVDVLLGGSGGGAGGGGHVYNFGTNQQAGGAGGGGGGSVAIICAGSILAQGGVFDVSGGDGGKGGLKDGSTSTSFMWRTLTGGGGGGAGGSLALISGDQIQLGGGILDARGGTGGVRGNLGTSTATCNACNAGGEGGDGFLFVMDADGRIDGLLPGVPGDYDGFANGVLTVRAFDASRFSSISAITELFPMTAADPRYTALGVDDVRGNVSSGQRVRVFVSSAVGDAENPLAPDPASEIPGFEVALVSFVGGGAAVAVTGDMADLNPPGGTRDAFVRVRAVFEYDNGVEAALGPFAAMDEMTIRYTFNG